MRIGNGRHRKSRWFSINEFWDNIGCLFSDPTFGIGVSSLWEKEEGINISGKKRKRCSIWIKVDLYEFCLSYIIYCLLFYFMTILIPFFTYQICGISLTRGNELRKYCPKGFELEEDKATDK